MSDNVVNIDTSDVCEDESFDIAKLDN